MSHRRKADEKRRLQKVYDETKNYILCGVDKDRRGVLFRWYPYSSNVNTKKQYRRMSNRVYRRKDHEEIGLGRSDFKKVFDLWWKVY